MNCGFSKHKISSKWTVDEFEYLEQTFVNTGHGRSKTIEMLLWGMSVRAFMFSYLMSKTDVRKNLLGVGAKGGQHL